MSPSVDGAQGFFDELAARGHEQLLFCCDPKSRYRGIIAIHTTAPGPAVGGTRLWSYASEAQAVQDALRLSRGMTYKCAVVGVPLGGGKAVILKPDGTFNREGLFRAHGRFVDRLGGRFITAEDVGVGPADLEWVHEETRHVKGLRHQAGDPSPYTALGVLRAIQAAAERTWGSSALDGRHVTVQGCGSVGSHLARQLKEQGARLTVADVDPERIAAVVAATGAEAVPPDEIHRVQADIFAPCALGGVLRDDTIPELNTAIVAGAANNQLLEPRHGAALLQRGILYVPDYVANAGGLISGCMDLLGWSRDEALGRIDGIRETLHGIFERADTDDICPSEAADRIVEERLARGGART